MASVDNILTKAAELYINELQVEMLANSQVVTGDTLNAIRSDVKSSGFGIYGPDYSGDLQDGRPPGPMSDEDFEHLQRWIEAKGLNINPWAVRKKIESSGTRLFRGADPRFSKPTDTFKAPSEVTVEYINKEITKFIRLELSSSIINAFK